MMMKMCCYINGLKPVLLMVLVQALYGGVHVVYKMATYDGMSVKILIAYRYMFASAFMLTLAFFVERKERPRLTWKIGAQTFLYAIFGGSLGQNLYVESLALTSATFVSAMSNLIPALLFILAVIFRMEKLGIGTFAGKAKVVGVIVSIGGAMIFIFCKGSEIKIWSTGINLLQNYDQSTIKHHTSQGLGSFLSITSSLSLTIWLLLQAKMSEEYPPYTATALMCVFASIQTTVYAMFSERDWSKWKLGWNIRLLTVLYAGIFPSGICAAIMAWCSKVKGALFVSAFYPLMLVFVAIAGSLFLDEHLHLDSLVGAIFIILGLYGVLWGKNKDLKQTSKMIPLKGSRNFVPTEATSINCIHGDEAQSTSIVLSVQTDQENVAN
ncbi:hypothetical protein FNV43_RR18777 [Rhamnella rubrinervis]|uniref:WAT1-related protein n=1 Tax=Rhamnella rubrinervis TaxID=2594499 RepID=A0A8K0E5R3_9ROSA|nr:hypothetical protein FNV43_RR18777 [Rhamnella rubrinervis]